MNREEMSLRERLQRQLFQMGAETQRGALFGRLRGSNPRETSVIVEHLLYENLMFHHRHFTMALNSLGRSSLWPLAISLLPEMRFRDLKPNTITYNAAVDACRKGSAKLPRLGMRPGTLPGYGRSGGTCRSGDL